MKKKSKLFFKLFLSILFTLVIAFYFNRSEKLENSYQNYFSKILHNFSLSTQEILNYSTIQNWFSPTLKADEREKFIQYKLIILSKSIGQYFKNLLQNTQKKLLNNRLKNSLSSAGLNNVNASKVILKKYIQQNGDIQEVSLFNLEGKKLIGLRYRNIPDYLITDNLILELKEKENLLLKHGRTSYLILLTLVKDKDKPLMIISQTINPSFFNRILGHLEMNKELYYLKDSHNYVLLNNYSSYKYEQEKNGGRPYDLYKALVKVDEKNLNIKFEKIEYYIGVVLEKNNMWGNIFATIFFIFIFSFSFILINWGIGLVYQLVSLNKIRYKFFTKKSKPDDLELETEKEYNNFSHGEDIQDLMSLSALNSNAKEMDYDDDPSENELIYGNSSGSYNKTNNRHNEIY